MDLVTRLDIELLVNSFYEKVKVDELLAPVFAHVDWPAHLPVMYNFWSSMLLGDQSYQGNPFQKHVGLSIKVEHFQQWLLLFHATIDENFIGDSALDAKNRATTIAGVWSYKLGL